MRQGHDIEGHGLLFREALDGHPVHHERFRNNQADLVAARHVFNVWGGCGGALTDRRVARGRPLVAVLRSGSNASWNSGRPLTGFRKAGLRHGVGEHFDQAFDGGACASQGIGGRDQDHILTVIGEVGTIQKENTLVGQVARRNAHHSVRRAAGQHPDDIHSLEGGVGNDQPGIAACANGVVVLEPCQLWHGAHIHIVLDGVVAGGAIGPNRGLGDASSDVQLKRLPRQRLRGGRTWRDIKRPIEGFHRVFRRHVFQGQHERLTLTNEVVVDASRDHKVDAARDVDDLGGVRRAHTGRLFVKELVNQGDFLVEHVAPRGSHENVGVEGCPSVAPHRRRHGERVVGHGVVCQHKIADHHGVGVHADRCGIQSKIRNAHDFHVKGVSG